MKLYVPIKQAPKLLIKSLPQGKAPGVKVKNPKILIKGK